MLIFFCNISYSWEQANMGSGWTTFGGRNGGREVEVLQWFSLWYGEASVITWTWFFYFFSYRDTWLKVPSIRKWERWEGSNFPEQVPSRLTHSNQHHHQSLVCFNYCMNFDRSLPHNLGLEFAEVIVLFFFPRSMKRIHH